MRKFVRTALIVFFAIDGIILIYGLVYGLVAASVGS